MTTSPEPTPEEIPGNRYRCNCGWSHTVREDQDGCSEDTETILLHIRSEHPEISAAAQADAAADTVTEEQAASKLGAALDSEMAVRTIKYRALRFRTFQDKADQERELLRSAVVACVGGGMSELQASKLSGVTRQTIRTWVGK